VSKLLPRLSKNETDILSPRILLLEVYQGEISAKEAPFFTIILEKEEVNSEGDFGLDSLTISYRVLDRCATGVGHGWFGASYDRRAKRLSITSDSMSRGAVFLDPEEIRGYRIGTYIMNQIILWAKHNYSSAILDTITLCQGQANLENKERRNRFYEQFGIKFNYSNDKKEEGKSNKTFINQLTTVETWKKNIKEVEITDYLIEKKETLKNQKQKIFEILGGNKMLQKEIDYYLKENIFQFILRKIKYKQKIIIEVGIILFFIFLIFIK
jgi:hypothetical protein